jgi:hypothetical protein
MPARPAPFPDLKTGPFPIDHERVAHVPENTQRKIKAMSAAVNRIIAVQMARSCDQHAPLPRAGRDFRGWAALLC